ncbi:hypothetical protein RLOatenuis_0710 [Rickettsiales bacterium]|nr:hypothetical protein RLOatenuis_0710 [Rickettsiales bacterium]
MTNIIKKFTIITMMHLPCLSLQACAGDFVEIGRPKPGTTTYSRFKFNVEPSPQIINRIIDHPRRVITMDNGNRRSQVVLDEHDPCPFGYSI